MCLSRCRWARGELMIRYHDEEWGVPVCDDQQLYEMLLLEAFQAGLSWQVVLSKRENFRRAFDGFDAKKFPATARTRSNRFCRIRASSAAGEKSRARLSTRAVFS